MLERTGRQDPSSVHRTIVSELQSKSLRLRLFSIARTSLSAVLIANAEGNLKELDALCSSARLKTEARISAFSQEILRQVVSIRVLTLHSSFEAQERELHESLPIVAACGEGGSAASDDVETSSVTPTVTQLNATVASRLLVAMEAPRGAIQTAAK